MRSAIYEGTVTHTRWVPFVHRLKFGLFSILLDLDELDRLRRRIPFFSHNRPNLVSFYDRDFGPRDGSDLRAWVEQVMHQHGVESIDRVRLLCLPRVFGYQFNPLTVWFVDVPSDPEPWVLYEIHNTFGESHSHVISPRRHNNEPHLLQKQLFVSPFFDVDGGYRVRIKQPAERFSMVIEYETEGRKALTATLRARRRPLTTSSLLRSLVKYPLVTLKVIAGIHWEALKLWLKGATYRSRPKAPVDSVTTETKMAA